MTKEITPSELYRSRKKEIDAMAKDMNSPILQGYARELIKIVRGDRNAGSKT